jgi:hypothetical protein
MIQSRYYIIPSCSCILIDKFAVFNKSVNLMDTTFGLNKFSASKGLIKSFLSWLRLLFEGSGDGVGSVAGVVTMSP